MADGPKPPPSEVIDAPIEDAGLFRRLQEWVKNSINDHADWYKEAEECFGFVAGRSLNGKGQWPGESWQQMMDSGRQPVEFNRVGPIVDAICGLEVNNRQEVKYLPRTQGDITANERLSSLGEWARDEANAEDEESQMFRNAVICGRGFTETRIDFDEEQTGRIIVDGLDPMEVGVDPAAKKACFTDARYFWRYRDVATDEGEAMFPGVLAQALHANWAERIDAKDGGEGNKRDYPDETRPGMKGDMAPKMVRLVQIQWWERRPMMLVAAPDAQEPQEMSVEAWEQVSEEATASGYTAQKIDKRRYRQAFLGRDSVLDESDLKGFTIRAVTGRLDRNKGYHYGVVRPMRDPQMLANKTLSQVLHILNSNAQGGLLIEAGAFRNPKDAEKDWSNPKKTILLNEGGIDKIKDRTPPPIPQALPMLQEFSLSSIRDVTGVSVEMLGLADREQAASLEYQRRQSAMTILASLFNGLRHYRKLHGKTMLDMLKMLPPGVLVRVLIDPEVAQAEFQQQMLQWAQAAAQAQQQGQQPPPQPEPPGAEFMSTTKRGEEFDPAKFGLNDDARFDVIVDEMSSSPNQKEATWAALQPFMGSLPPEAIPIALRYSPLPETAAKELGEAISGAAQGPEIPDEIKQLIEQGKQQIAQLTEENAALKGDQQLAAAKIGIQQQDSQTKRITALANATQPNEIDELRGHIQTLAANQQAIMQALNGGQGYGG